MQLNEFYSKVGGNYDEVKSRLMTDDRILRFLQKFPSSDDFDNLKRTLSEKKWDEAFRFSHNLKGICLNLGLVSLYEVSSALCENLRGGLPKEDCSPMMEKVEAKYLDTIKAIKEL